MVPIIPIIPIVPKSQNVEKIGIQLTASRGQDLLYEGAKGGKEGRQKGEEGGGRQKRF